MAAEQPRFCSIRLVYIDHYMAPPIPGVDIAYSSFQGAIVNEVPVIRIYGPTQAGQKMCLHIHKAFPYLYVPIPDVQLADADQGENFASSLAHALEKSLKLRGDVGSKRQHVHGYDLVRAKKFYGYHCSEDLFIKIYLYYPSDVTRAANLLLGGTVMEKSFQPHESHVPFILQFMIDYNLHGMSHVHLSRIRFRHPVPSASKFSQNSTCGSFDFQAEVDATICCDSGLWVSSNIPDGWMWPNAGTSDVSTTQEKKNVERQSNCELEGDATIDEIINHQSKSYTSLSQTSYDVKMVESLIPIWEDEHQRRGYTADTLAPDPGKPCSVDALRSLLDIPDIETKLRDLCCQSNHPAVSSAEKQCLVGSDDGNFGINEEVADTEALALLKWLAVAQPTEDIDSGEELACETMLTPQMPSMTMDRVLERTNSDFNIESQRECQDILDSVEDVKSESFFKDEPRYLLESKSERSSLRANNSVECQLPVLQYSSETKDSVPESEPPTKRLKVALETRDAKYETRNNWDESTTNINIGEHKEKNDENESSVHFACTPSYKCGSMTMETCSVRDLMRKKRHPCGLEKRIVPVFDKKFTSEVKEGNSRVENMEERILFNADIRMCEGMTSHKSSESTFWADDASKGQGVRGQDFIAAYSVDLEKITTKSLNTDCDDSCSILEEIEGTEPEIIEDSSHEAVSDVDTHYLNDGTILYLLTPSMSPPSPCSVRRWLMHDYAGLPLGTQDPSPGDQSEACVEPDFSTDCTVLECKQHDASHICDKKFDLCAGNGSHDKETTTVARTGFPMYDISQISGPSQKSLSTPLSQTGFRDPASVGGSQMLTILSVEVLSESRGDLRPDPRFDAISIISLVVQNDNDSEVESHVLLHSNSHLVYWNSDGVSRCKVTHHSDEKSMFNAFARTVKTFDPDVLIGWDIQAGSLGYLAERAAHLGIGLLCGISRTPNEMNHHSEVAHVLANRATENSQDELVISSSPMVEDGIIKDEWGRTHVSGVHVNGRIVLNLWRIIRGEIKLTMYTLEAVAEAVLRQKIPSIPLKVLAKWFWSQAQAQYRCVDYVTRRTKLNLEILNQLDIVNRTSELARVFGIDFFSVLSRGSQYRVESMLLRLAHTQNYLAVSPGYQQVAAQPAMECLPLVMEPESSFYADPVLVLDFQSLYPSMIIAYNLCFSTCLGNVEPTKVDILGVTSYSPDIMVLQGLMNDILLTPNGVMYVPSKVRKGVLPRLLEEILSTRIMVKQAMKKLAPSEHVLRRIFNSRQLALKLIANVTYGYTAAGFSGRMPCAELADSIVQCGRRTLEKAINLVNDNENWKARVVYGDTDSMFVLLPGRSRRESFEIGRQIASAVSEMNPHPVALKFEKVYHPCFLLTKKRYVGYSYESPDQVEPLFDAKGIETVRRDSCGVVTKMMEKSLRLFFERQNISEVKVYLQRQWKRILSGRVPLQDFVFAKEVRLGTYSTRSASSLPPSAIVATKAMKADPRAEPRYAERVPYVVIHGEPGARLVDMVVDPMDLLAIDSSYRLNDVYYINKQIIPALQRVFGLVGGDLNKWFLEMPRPGREKSLKRPLYALNSNRTRIDYYYLSRHCVLCGEMVHESTQVCNTCLEDETSAATAIIQRTSKLEKELHHLSEICRHCGGADWVVDSGVKCTSLACSVFYERRKVQKEFYGICGIASERGLYPKCAADWF